MDENELTKREMSDEQITAAHRVVEGMSFTPLHQSNHQISSANHERWCPPAPMPAAPAFAPATNLNEDEPDDLPF